MQYINIFIGGYSMLIILHGLIQILKRIVYPFRKGPETIVPTSDQLWYIDEDANLRVNYNSVQFKEAFYKNVKALSEINSNKDSK